MASLGRLLFQRFQDARDEQRFRLELRRRQTKFVRALMFIGAAMLSVYVFLAPLYLSLAGTVALLLATLAMAPLLALYAWYVGRPGYAANRWIEIGFFAAMEPREIEERAHLVDIESGEAHDLGPVPSPAIQFDPTSRYLVLAGRVWSTSPLRSRCTLP